MTEFLEEWFGRHAGREVLKDHGRQFIETPKELAFYVQYCRENKQPAYMSVQPFSVRDQPFGLEKLFFEFDCKGDIPRAWQDAKAFALALEKYYSVQPFIMFSGRKGFHVDVFLTRTVQFPLLRLGFVKAIYDKLQRKLLKGLKFETLDQAVLGDIKRLERVPYSVHEKTGEICVPVDLDRNSLSMRSLEPYREHGLDTRILERICKEIVIEKELREAFSEKKRKTGFKPIEGVRPCLETALNLPLHKGEGHKIRLAVAVEYLHKGFSMDQVVELFRSQVDFDEKKTRYYVEDAQRKGYKPFKCKTIRELGFCLKDQCSINRSIDREEEGQWLRRWSAKSCIFL